MIKDNEIVNGNSAKGFPVVFYLCVCEYTYLNGVLEKNYVVSLGLLEKKISLVNITFHNGHGNYKLFCKTLINCLALI